MGISKADAGRGAQKGDDHMTGTVKPSPFSYEGTKELKIIKSPEGVPFPLKGVDTAVIRILAKYRLLNRFNLEKELAMMLPRKLHKPDYKKELKMLEEKGYLLRYVYAGTDEKEQTGRENLNLYGLTGIGYKEAAKREIYVQHKVSLEGMRLTTTAALELASLNQWHIGIRRLYSDMIQSEYYQEFRHVKRDKGIILPSVFVLKGRRLSLAKRMTLAALPYPKKRKEIGTFLNTILGINAFVKENADTLPFPMYIILVDGFGQMEEACREVYNYKLLQPMDLYFAMDINTAGERILRWIYQCSISSDETNIRYETVNLLTD